MTYLRLIKSKIQNWSETVSSALNIDVAVADKNLIRIAGTGNFYNRLEEVCPEDSLFAKVIKSGTSKINLITKNEPDCLQCSNFDNCKEHANMSCPLIVDEEIIGVISFASFDQEQSRIMNIKRDEYFKMLKQTAEMIQNEISQVKITNKMKSTITEVNELINCLNKGIVILSSNHKIMHINVKALDILKINVSTEKVMDTSIDSWIKNMDKHDTNSEDIIDFWTINNRKIRVRYSINKILMKDNDYFLMISFDKIKEIIDIAKTFVNKGEIHFDHIIGESNLLMKSIEKAKIAAVKDSTILIQGESGTGKELLARSIHNESSRKDGAFVAINCAGIPESLIESELFGYEGGAFTGALSSGKKGKIELANNGTLFLDEIGDLPIHMQTKLLRVLQERTIDKIGSSGKSIDINIRVIAATHRNLHSLVKEGTFRLDLFYRLNVIPILLPPLRDRNKDVLLCSNYIIKNLSEKLNTDNMQLSDEVKDFFMKYYWPGNLRELENILEHGMCFSTDNIIKFIDLPEYCFKNYEEQSLKLLNGNLEVLNSEGAFSEKEIIKSQKNLEELKMEFEKQVINRLLEVYGDSAEGKKLVSEKLNIGLSTLYKKMNYSA